MESNLEIKNDLTTWSVAELTTEIKRRSKTVTKIRFPADVFLYMYNQRNKQQEHFWVLHLDANHQIISKELISKGLVNRTPVHPREIFRSAIKKNVIAIIAVHNHPSGNTAPSDEDDEITNRIYKAGEIVGIKLVDHVIIGKDSYYSYLEEERSPIK